MCFGVLTKTEIEKMIFEQEQHIEREERIMQKHIKAGDVVTAFKYERVIFGHMMAKFALKRVIGRA